MRLPLRLSDLVVVFAAIDAGMSFLLLQTAGQVVLGLAVAAGAVIALLVYVALPARGARTGALLALVAVTMLLPQALLIHSRGPGSAVNDAVLVTDAAADRLLHGLDPYGHDYIDSAMRSFYMPEVPVSFSLAHYVYMPGMVLLDLPLRALGLSFAWALIPGLVLLAAAALALGRNAAERTAALLALVLSPAFLFDYLYLFNDLFFLAPAVASFALLRRRQPLAAGILFGLALVIKQTALLLAPFLVFAALRELDPPHWWRAAAAAAAVVLLVTVPFVVWNPHAFFVDTAAFFYGSGVESYPIRGVGFAGLLLEGGLLPSRWSPYPGAFLQAATVLPVLVLAAFQLRLASSAQFWPLLWAWLGVEVITTFFFGRVLAPNYLDIGAGFLILALALALEHGAPAPARIVRGIDAPARQ